MKTRVISAMVGLVVLALALIFLDTLLFNVLLGLISIIAVHELLQSTGLTKFRKLTVLAMVTACVIPFARAGYINRFLMPVMFVLILLFFIVLLSSHNKIGFEQVAMAFFFSTIVPVFFSCAVYIRDDFGRAISTFYILLALGSAWLSDTGAYFVGCKFGKHKLAPVVSPKKTVEGAIGGVVICTLFMQIIALVFSIVMTNIGSPVDIKFLLLLFVTPVFSVIGMLGDLSASVIKREFGVKDFGYIMPGHGGIMDRFDSVLFTLPAVFIFVQNVTVVSFI